MKILVIGDIHGRDSWKTYVNNALLNFVDKIIFLGDYVDSFNIQPDEIVDNLKNIIELKKIYPDKFVLLLGNHDYSYYFSYNGTSGYNYYFAHEYFDLFKSNWDLFDIVWGYTNDNHKYTLLIHAGLSKTYWNKNILNTIKDKDSYVHKINDYIDLDSLNNKPVHEILNFYKNDNNTLWKVGSIRGGSGYGSILWADKSEIKKDPFPNINQVIGHTSSFEIELQINNDDSLLSFIDLRGENPGFLKLNL